MNFDHVKNIVEFIVLIAGVPMALIQIIILIKQIKESAKQLKIQTEWNRMNVTFEYLSKYRLEVQEAYKNYLEFINQNDISLLEEKLQDVQFRTDVMKIVSYFIQFSQGLQKKYFDEEIAKNTISLTFIKTYVSLKPYIEIRKKEEGFEIAQSFKSIAKKWNDDYKLSYEI